MKTEDFKDRKELYQRMISGKPILFKGDIYTAKIGSLEFNGVYYTDHLGLDLGHTLGCYKKIIEQKTNNFYQPKVIHEDGDRPFRIILFLRKEKFKEFYPRAKVIEWGECTELPIKDDGSVDYDAIKGLEE